MSILKERLTTPDLRAILDPINVLSPVIITTSISAYLNVLIVGMVSAFNLF